MNLEYAEKYSESHRLTSHAGDDHDTEKSTTTLTRRLDTTHEINDALRSQFETSTTSSFASTSFPLKSKQCGSMGATELSSFVPKRTKSTMSVLPLERTLESHAEVDESTLENGDLGRGAREESESRREGELDVSVRIEQTVSVERARRRMREDYRTPRTMWDSRGSVSGAL